MDNLIILDSENSVVKKQKTDLATTVSTFLKNFLSENTRCAYTTDFYDFAAFLEVRNIRLNGPHEITKDHVIDYRDSIINHYAPNTVHRKLSSLSSLFKELINAKLMDENPALGVKRPKAKSIRPKTGLSDSELESICEFYDGVTTQSLQNKTILTFLAYTGCRISEVVNVRVCDIRTENDIKVVIIKGKGSKIRKIPLHPKLWSTLKELMRRREKIEDDYIFTAVKKRLDSPIRRESVHEMLKKTLLALDMDIDKTLHSFRRGVISNLLENGHRIESVAEVSGHSNINTTKGYLVREEKIEDNPLLSLNFKKS
ncbi:MAG: tyrosine-type recombinase/integrase [Halobacteriovoraceae bacterium]|nr:tyrosine-type recombinase/integrase [Halobacteriovoraceae bacterium]